MGVRENILVDTSHVSGAALFRNARNKLRLCSHLVKGAQGQCQGSCRACSFSIASCSRTACLPRASLHDGVHPCWHPTSVTCDPGEQQQVWAYRGWFCYSRPGKLARLPGPRNSGCSSRHGSKGVCSFFPTIDDQLPGQRNAHGHLLRFDSCPFLCGMTHHRRFCTLCDTLHCLLVDKTGLWHVQT